jgi:MFS family permease
MSRIAKIVWLFGLTQIIGYGALYYSFAILADDVARTFGWNQEQFFLAFSVALAASGLIAPRMGRALDRYGAARVMAWGSAASTICLGLLAVAPWSWVFASALILSQIAATFVLYDAAFTALVQATGGKAQLRIVHLTLIAGFASSIFWPLTHWLDAALGWRIVLGLYAALNLIVCLPVHALVARWRREGIEADGPSSEAVAAASEGQLRAKQRRRAFILIASGFSLSSFALSAVLSQMVPMLSALGFGSTALVVSTLFGPAQVAVRFINMMLGSRRHPLTVTFLALSLLPLGLFIVAATAPHEGGAVAFVILVGLCSGLKSIVQGTLILALFGSEGFGRRAGLLASSRFVLGALAPFAFAWTSAQSSAAIAMVLFGVIGAIAVLVFVDVARMLRR